MDKRYQIFVSSTYADLREERQRVIQALMGMDCIPSGMELFPAADEEQWEFIKRVIDDCDYYLLIIGGRYGSITAEGISYTEKEYDYAVGKGMKVIALLHANPEEIPTGKSEIDPELRGMLKAFRERVAKNRLVKFWVTTDELPGLLALSLSKTMKLFPAVGWVRADQTSNTQLLSEINELRKKKEQLEAELAESRESQADEIPNLASLDDVVEVKGSCTVRSGSEYQFQSNSYDWRCECTWREIFALISPHLLENPVDSTVRRTLSNALYRKNNSERDCSTSIDDQIFQTIKIQFQALKLVAVRHLKTTQGGMGLFWSLTKTGHSLMLSTRTVKSGQP